MVSFTVNKGRSGVIVRSSGLVPVVRFVPFIATSRLKPPFSLFTSHALYLTLGAVFQFWQSQYICSAPLHLGLGKPALHSTLLGGRFFSVRSRGKRYA